MALAMDDERWGPPHQATRAPPGGDGTSYTSCHSHTNRRRCGCSSPGAPEAPCHPRAAGRAQTPLPATAIVELHQDTIGIEEKYSADTAHLVLKGVGRASGLIALGQQLLGELGDTGHGEG